MRIYAIKNISSSPISFTTKGVNGYGGSTHHLIVGQEIELCVYELSPDIAIKCNKNLLSKVEKPEIKVISTFSANAGVVEVPKTEKPPLARGRKKKNAI